MAYDNDYGCAIDPKFVSSLIKDFINASDWKISRVEIYSTKSFTAFYYCTNELGYVVFDWAESHSTTKDLVDSLVVMGKNNS